MLASKNCSTRRGGEARCSIEHPRMVDQPPPSSFPTHSKGLLCPSLTFLPQDASDPRGREVQPTVHDTQPGLRPRLARRSLAVSETEVPGAYPRTGGPPFFRSIRADVTFRGIERSLVSPLAPPMRHRWRSFFFAGSP